MRVLIATVTAGRRHLQAAAALDETWTTAYPSDEVKQVDLLDLVPKLQRKFYAEGYVKLIAHAPELYELFFNKTDNPKRLRELSTLRPRFAEHTNRKFVRLVNQFKPDVVLCTHFLPLEVLGSLEGRKIRRSPLYGVRGHRLRGACVVDGAGSGFVLRGCRRNQSSPGRAQGR